MIPTKYEFSSFGSDNKSLELQFQELSLESNNPLDVVKVDDFGPHKKGVWRILPISANRVVTACYDHLVRIFNIDDSHQTQNDNPLVLKGHSREVLSLAWQNQTLLTGSSDGRMCFWNPITGGNKGAITENVKTGFYSLALLENQIIATGACQRPKNFNMQKNWQHNIKIWDIANLRFKMELKGHQGGISSLKSVGNRLISASADKSIRIWNVESKKLISTFDKAHEDYIYSIDVLSDDQIASGSRDRKIKIWNLETGKCTKNLCMGSESIAHSSTVYEVAIYQGNLLLSGSRDGLVKVWDLRSAKCIKSLDANGRFVYSVAGLESNRIAAGLDVPKEQENEQAGLRIWEFKR